MKTEKISLKTRVIFGTIYAIILMVGRGLWDYFKGDPLNYGKYVMFGVGGSLFFSWLFFRYKIVQDKK
jgi:hypothetical protein